MAALKSFPGDEFPCPHIAPHASCKAASLPTRHAKPTSADSVGEKAPDQHTDYLVRLWPVEGQQRDRFSE